MIEDEKKPTGVESAQEVKRRAFQQNSFEETANEIDCLRQEFLDRRLVADSERLRLVSLAGEALFFKELAKPVALIDSALSFPTDGDSNIVSFLKAKNDFQLSQIKEESGTDSITLPAQQETNLMMTYGHSELYKKVAAYLEANYGAKCRDFESEKVPSQQIHETLKNLYAVSEVSVVVATCDDIFWKIDKTFPFIHKVRRIRQNVIHEIGIAQGKYGFEKVVILMEKNAEHFSNLDGFLRIDIDKNAIEDSYEQLDRFMDNLGVHKRTPRTIPTSEASY